jgi:hypothetical protein
MDSKTNPVTCDSVKKRSMTSTHDVPSRRNLLHFLLPSVGLKEGEVCDIVEVVIPTIHCTEDGREGAFVQEFLA